MTAPTVADAREEIVVASDLLAGDHCRQAVSRAYYAAFYAASVAIDAVGQRRAKHSGVFSAFGRHLVKTGHVSTAAAEALRDLFDKRNRADYIFDPVGVAEAEEAISQATLVVDAVEAWLDERDVSSAG